MQQIISVIVPVYNASATLDRCILSILNQTVFDKLEVILVEDGSTDGSKEMCRSYAKNSNIVLLESDHRGISHSRNLGIEYAHCDFIGFVDSDDFIEPEMYERLLSEFTDDEVDAAVTSYNDIWGNDKIGEGSFYELTGQTVNDSEIVKALKHYYSDYQNIPCYVTNFLFRKEVVARFTEGLQFMEDAEFLSRVFFGLRKIRFTDSHLYNYFYNPVGVTKSKENVYSNIVDLTFAGNRIRDNFVEQGVYDAFSVSLTRMQCLGIINKLSLLSKEKINGIREIVSLCIKNKEVRDYFNEVDVSRFSFRTKIFVRLVKAGKEFLLSFFIRLKGFRKSLT